MHGVTDACCDLALQQSAFIVNPSVNPKDYRCGQVYSSHLSPAPDLSVSQSWCEANCDHYALYKPSETNEWALPLIQFILPAVIFSMAIPRRLALKPLSRRSGIWFAILSFVADGIILILDVTFWVFAIIIAPMPFMLSGLFEVMLDYKVTRYATSRRSDQHLTQGEQVEVLTAVLAGNLGIEGVPANPQQELKTRLGENADREARVNSLLSMLTSQAAFGGVVGAAILLYIGSFVYTLSSLNASQGDHGTARALAFGIWWMTIVHVSAVSGSLLASNNPSTAAAIVGRLPEHPTYFERLARAQDRSELEDRVQASVEAFLRVPLACPARYEPAWMWSRGKCKAAWLRQTSAWNNDSFSELIAMSVWSWSLLTLSAYLLVFVPCALAFWIEYQTPSIGIKCRAMTILLYIVAQTIFVLLSAWSHFKAVQEDEFWKHDKWGRKLNRLRQKWVGILVGISILLPTWLLAVFVTFVGTLAQITGIFQNCTCAATYTWSYRPTSTVSLASDTLQDRLSSSPWNKAGYAALGILSLVTYLGWWFQRSNRDLFEERVKHLRGDNNGGAHQELAPFH